jgi:hypothetical protein
MIKKSISTIVTHSTLNPSGNKRLVLLRVLGATAVAATLLADASACASSGIVINDPSTILYGVQDNRVYLRNLNTYESDWLPCCYNYWIDLSTDGGKAMFSALLAHKLSGKRLSIWKTDPTTPGPIDIIGDF